MSSSLQENTSGALPARQVITRLGKRIVALPADHVAEMLQLPELTELPQSPAHMRGVMMLRGQAVGVFDLRGILGMQTRTSEVDELVELLTQREQDHRNWIAELERCAREGEPFKLAKDPHKCAFGKWYDHFVSGDLLLDNQLRRFDAPHKRIHALAEEVDQLVESGQVEGALRRIEQTRDGELSEMIRLFEETRSLLRSTTREIAVVMRDADGHQVAYSVDVVESVQELTPTEDTGRESTHRLAFYGQDQQVAVMLEADDLLDPTRVRAA